MGEPAETPAVDAVFGEKKWRDLQAALYVRLRNRFWAARHEDLEEAVGHATVAALDQWLDFPTSVSDDPARNFNYAVYWATSEASRYLVKLYQGREGTYALVGEDEEDEAGHTPPATYGPQSVERHAIRPEPREQDPLADRLDHASEEELRAWVQGLEGAENTPSEAP